LYADNLHVLSSEVKRLFFSQYKIIPAENKRQFNLISNLIVLKKNFTKLSGFG